MFALTHPPLPSRLNHVVYFVFAQTNFNVCSLPFFRPYVSKNGHALGHPTS